MLNPNPIIEADFEGNLLYANPATAQVFPDLKEKLNSHPIFDDWEQTVKRLKDQTNFQKEAQINENWFITQYFLVPETQKIRVYFVPINEMKKIQQELRCWISRREGTLRNPFALKASVVFTM